MNLFKSTNSSNNPNAGSNKGDLSGPRFQNKNLNSFRALPPSGRTGQSKPGVQVIQAKQKLGKAVGAAALPPTPLNTPSLKRETETNHTSQWNGQGTQSHEDGSPSLKGLTGPAKPAPWAKPGTNAEVEKAEEPKDEPVSASKQQPRSWANADDSDDDERQEDVPSTDWPDNFRETGDSLPVPTDQATEEGDQRYVPPFVRNKAQTNSSSGPEGSRPFRGNNHHHSTNDQDNFYDSHYMSQGPGGNRHPPFRESRDRDFPGPSGRGWGGGGGEEHRQENNRGNRFQYKGRYEGDPSFSEPSNNRVSSRFNNSQGEYPPAERSFREGRYEGETSHYRGPERGGGGPGPSYPPANRNNHDHNNFHHSGEAPLPRYNNSRYPREGDSGNFQRGDRRGFNNNYHHPEGDSGDFRQRSRGASEDFQQKTSSSFHHPHHRGETGGPPDDSVDLRGIESSRLEAEFLESRKVKAPSQDYHPAHQQQFGGGFGASRQVMTSEDNQTWQRGNPRASQGPFSSSLAQRPPRYESSDRGEASSSDYVARRNLQREGGGVGTYRGQDAVKLSFPQPHSSQGEEESHHLYSSAPSDSHSPHSSSDPAYLRYQSDRDPHRPHNYHQPSSSSYNNQQLSRSGEEFESHRGGPRPKQLFDPKSDQLVDAAASSSGAVTEGQRSRQRPLPSSSQTQREGEDRWPKILQHDRRDLPPPQSESEREGRGALAEEVSDPRDEKARLAEERKAARQKERMERQPRTKGFLYRYNDRGELERVMSDWEKEQETLAQKKAALGEATPPETVTVIKKHESSEGGGNHSHKKAEAINKTTVTSPPGVSAPSSGLEGGGNSTILGTLMQGSSSLFDSWNRPPPGIGEDSRVSSDLPAQTSSSSMNWLTGTSSSSGLSSLAVGGGLAGIISTSNSLFPNNQQDWSYNSILTNDDPTSQSVFSQINRPANSFSPFSGLNVASNIERDASSSSTSNPNPAPDNSKFIQREWQRFAQANAFGAVGNKPSATPTTTAAKTSTTSEPEKEKDMVSSSAPVAPPSTSSSTYVIEPPPPSVGAAEPTTSSGRGEKGGRGRGGGRRDKAVGRGRPSPRSASLPEAVVTTTFHTRITSTRSNDEDKSNHSNSHSDDPAIGRPPPRRNPHPSTAGRAEGASRRAPTSSGRGSSRGGGGGVGRSFSGPRAQSEVKHDQPTDA